MGTCWAIVNAVAIAIDVVDDIQEQTRKQFHQKKAQHKLYLIPGRCVQSKVNARRANHTVHFDLNVTFERTHFCFVDILQ